MVSWYNFLSTSFNQSFFFFLPGVKREKDRDLVMWAVGCLPADVKNCRVDVGNLGAFCSFVTAVSICRLPPMVATWGCNSTQFAGYPPKSHHHQVLHSKCYLEATSKPLFRQCHIPTWLYTIITRTPWHHGLLHGISSSQFCRKIGPGTSGTSVARPRVWPAVWRRSGSGLWRSSTDSAPRDSTDLNCPRQDFYRISKWVDELC